MNIMTKVPARAGLAAFALFLLQACPGPQVIRYEQGATYNGTFESLNSCTPNETSQTDGLHRLTEKQYENIYSDILPASFASLQDQIASIISVVSDNIAISNLTQRYSRFTQQADDVVLHALWSVAKGLSDSIGSDVKKASDLLGACAAKPDDACYTNFILRFGFLTERRLIPDDEVKDFLTWSATFSTLQKRVGAIVARMLMSPQFMYQLYTDGSTRAAGGKQIYAMSSYEIAARVYLHYANSAPDAAALDWAKGHPDPSRSDISDLLSQLFASHKDRVRETAGDFYEEWTLTNRVQRFEVNSADFKTLAQGEIINTNNDGADLAQHMREETRDFANYITFDKTGENGKNGSLYQLFTDRSSFAKTDDLAQIYDVPKLSDANNPPQLGEKEHSGLLTRAAFVANTLASSNLIIRGVNTRREILCDTLGNPPDNFSAAPPADLVGHENSREIFRIKTADASCMGCHANINPLGFAMEDIDTIGRHRNKERVIGQDGNEIAQLDLDLQVDGNQLNISGRGDRPVNGSIDLSESIGESLKAHQCFARQYFRFARSRLDQAQPDKCSLQNMQAVISSDKGDIQTMMKAFAMDDAFRSFVMER